MGFHQGQAEQLPYMDASFDRVLAIALLCLVEDPGPVISEIARVLKPGGRLILGDLNRWSLWALKRRIKGWVNPQSPWKRANFHSAAELHALLEAHGLAVETVRGTLYSPPWEALSWMAVPLEKESGRSCTWGAAFLALTAIRLK